MIKLFRILLVIFLSCCPISSGIASIENKDTKGLKKENVVKRIEAVRRSIFNYDFPGLTKEISVDFRDIELIYAIKFLAQEGGLDVIGSQGVKGTVSLFIENITIGEAFDKILALNDLAFQVQGKVIEIISNEEYKAKNGVDFYDSRDTAIYKLKYASSTELATMLGDVKSSIGKIIYNESSGMLILIDVPQKIAEMDEIINEAETPTHTEVFGLQYASVEDIVEKVKQSLSDRVGKLDFDERTNKLIVTDIPEKIQRISDIIKAFDQKTKEVFIEAKIVQVTLSDAYKWGVDWSRLIKNAFGSNIEITPSVNLPIGLTTFGKISVAKMGSTNLDMVLEMLSSVGETRILSNPHIAIQDGKEAALNVITKQPYSETTTTTTDAATTESTEFTFVDVGVKLNVTPEINDNGYINMLIKPEVSSITSFFPDSTSENRVPVVETSNAETSVLVKDGVTVIIAGMIKDMKSKSVNKIPVVGDVPLLGKLFRNVSDEVQRTETIVFLTPKIISGDDSYLLERDKKKERKGLRVMNSKKERKGLKE